MWPKAEADKKEGEKKEEKPKAEADKKEGEKKDEKKEEKPKAEAETRFNCRLHFRVIGSKV